MVPTSASPSFSVSPEVAAYAAEKRVTDYLEPVLEMTRRQFPDARRLAAFVEDDPDIADFRYLILRVDLPPIDPTQAVEREFQWDGELVRLFPYSVALAFTLRMRIADA
jgi:hypothetical protein